MAFTKRREYLFLYSVKDANPNGDPLNANHPRFDAETGRIMVSDVRIKRTMRDQWLREGLNIFVDGAAKTLKTRIEELKSALKVKTGKEALQQCIDTRLFGVTFAHGNEAFSWTGPVQFKWGRSLHQAKAELIQGTAAFATRDQSEQRSFRNEYIVPFVLLGVYAIANQHASVETGATDEDVDKIAGGLWNGTVNLITRSKIGHVPRLLVEVIYQEGFSGAAGSMDEKVNLLSSDGQTLSADEELAIRSPKDFLVDINEVSEKLISLKGHIEAINVWLDSELAVKGLDELKAAFNEKLAVQKEVTLMAVAFNVSAPIAMFRRPYTTTSSVSFPIPPPTAIAGLLGAIIGLPNGSDEKAFYAKYWDEMKGTKIALSVINPISWFLTSINFWNLKEPQKSPHIRVKHQFVRQPKYRIYVHGGVEEKLRQHLENGTFIYTPFLGTAYAIAEIEYLGQFPLQAVEENEISLASVLPLLDNQTVKIDIFASKGIFRDTLPFSLSSERSLIKTINTIYTSSAKEKIHLTSWEGLDVTAYKDEYIAWFPAW